MSTPDRTPPLLPLETVTRLIDEAFPGIHAGGRRLHIESVADRFARVRLVPSERSIRPGGTISGPAMFTLADFSIYVALIATLCESAIPSVTSNLNINFLARPEPRDVIADARLIRVGRRLAYAEVHLVSDGARDVICHATGTYALTPPKPKA